MADVTPLRGKAPAAPEGFGAGAVVRLKSGGPAMTVKHAVKGDAPSLMCEWFAGSEEELRAATFLVDQLTRDVALPADGDPTTPEDAA